MDIQAVAKIAPSERQLKWNRMEMNAFVHFGVNTFMDSEWGSGKEDPGIFRPEKLDAAQWVRACKDAGIKGLILTCKHHDGFCLWPSAFTEHSVKNSPWKNGKGDVVKEVSDACRAEGLKFGVYLSPWDRNHPLYGDDCDAYNTYFLNQLRELLTNYGDIFCVWFDGACGEGASGRKQYYDWEAYYALIRELQPEAVISICGPDVRWCGNEAGKSRESEWSVVPVSCADICKIAERSQQADDAEFIKKFSYDDEDLGSREVIRNEPELMWYPCEVNTSIRPGWFYHEAHDNQVRSLDELIRIYYGSVGGNSCFLLNIPPNKEGLFHENDVQRLRELGQFIRKTFGKNVADGAQIAADNTKDGFAAEAMLQQNPDTYWCTDEGVETANIEIKLSAVSTFDRIVLQECIRQGQRIEKFKIAYFDSGEWKPLYAGTVVGYKKICCFDMVTTDRIKITIEESRWQPTLSFVGVYQEQR